jgi:hypothetical protein
MNINVTSVGYAQAVDAARLVGEAAKALTGSIAVFGSLKPYARPVETGERRGRPWRRAGPALMFQRGIAATEPMVAPLIMEAIPKGAGSVGQAKRKIRDAGIANIQANTPVVSGALRADIQEFNRLQ